MVKNNVVDIRDDSEPEKNAAISESAKEPQTKNILQLTNLEARKFFLKSKSYCNFDLPDYFTFNQVLSDLDSALSGKNLSDFRINSPRDFDDINYKILNNKDGRYAWRPMQLIHPALYVSLVHKITQDEHWQTISNRFEQFSKNSRIECISLPIISLTENSDKAEQVSNWWHEVEQRSIELALDYECLTQTDVTD